MPATREAEPGSSRRAPRRPVAVGLSLALHLGLLYAVTRAPMLVSEAHTPPPPAPSVVWLRDLPPREAPPTSKRTGARKPPPEEPPPAAAEPPPQAAPPPIDWDKERSAAVRNTINNPAPQYRTFTYDDVPKRKPQPLPIEPVPPAKIDNCAIFKNIFQAALLGMIGKCVRDARSDLFAGARPPYMDEHPVCRETRPDSPGAITSDGRVISTVKCDLVAEDEKGAAAGEPR